MSSLGPLLAGPKIRFCFFLQCTYLRHQDIKLLIWHRWDMACMPSHCCILWMLSQCSLNRLDFLKWGVKFQNERYIKDTVRRTCHQVLPSAMRALRSKAFRSFSVQIVVPEVGVKDFFFLVFSLLCLATFLKKPCPNSYVSEISMIKS